MNFIAESRRQLDLAAALRAAMEELDPSDWRTIHDMQNEANEAQREGEKMRYCAICAQDIPPASPYSEEQEYEALRIDVRSAGHPI